VGALPRLHRLRPRDRPIGAKYRDVMAYDEELADRIRDLVAGQKGLTEKRMFGGLAFLIGGNMAVAASGQGGILVRVDPDATEKLVSTTKAERMVMRGRSMDGWLRVDAADVRQRRSLEAWVKRGITYARSLPAKA
jgi:TfoX/Sxy family transcriptional regulator of competence genes